MKNMLSFVLVFIILIFSCIPVFAYDDYVDELDPNIVYDNQYIIPQKSLMLKSGTRSVSSSNITVDENYLNFYNLASYNITSSAVASSAYDYINNYVNVENAKIYLYPTLRQVDGRFGSAFLIVGSVNEMSIDDTQQVGSFASNTLYNSDYTLSNIYRFDNTTVEYSVYTGFYRSTTGRWQSSTSAVTFPNNTYYVDFTKFNSSNFLLFDSGNCVSVAFCSEDYLYVPSVDEPTGDDYSGFLSTIITEIRKIPTKLTETITEIRNLPTTILNGIRDIFIPDTEQMKDDFDDFVSYLESKLGYGPLIDTLRSMVSVENGGNISVASADVHENVTFSFNGVSVPVEVSLPFSSVFSSTAKGYMTDLLKGFFFVLLLFYNLSEIYFLIRGSRPFKDSRSSVSTGNNSPIFELDSGSGMFVAGRSDWEKKHIH